MATSGWQISFSCRIYCSLVYRVHVKLTWLHAAERLTGPQLSKKFSAFYVTRRFINSLTSARHLSLSCARSVQSIPPIPQLKIHVDFILPSMPRYSKWSLFLSFPPPKPCTHVSCSHSCYMSRPSHLLNFITRIIFGKGEDQKASRYVVFSTTLIRRLSYHQLSSSAPCSRTPSACVLPPV